jgi:hypothetical protein
MTREVGGARGRLGESSLSVMRVADAPGQIIRLSGRRELRQSRVAVGDKMYLVRVIVEVGPDLVTVVTAYRTGKIEKYWRQS